MKCSLEKVVSTSRRSFVFLTNKPQSSLTHYSQVELHVPGGRVPVVHPAPVHALVHHRHLLDHQRRPGPPSPGGEPEVRPAPEAEGGFCRPVLARPRRSTPATDLLITLLTPHQLPEVEAVERLAGELPVPEDEVDLVGGVGRGDVTGQLGPAVLDRPHVQDGN